MAPTAPSKTEKTDGKGEKSSAPTSSSKIEKNNNGKGEKSTAIASVLEHHEKEHTKLEEQKKALDNEVYQGMYTEEHQEKQNAVETQLQKYTSTAAQVNVKKGPIAGSTEPMNLDGAEQIKKETSATNPVPTQPDVATQVPDPKKTSAGDQQQVSGSSKMKKELVDNLNMKWDIDVNDSRGESSLQHLPKEVFGHIMKSSRTRFCVRYGSKEGLSARFESILPNASDYKQERDVTQGSERIVEKIVQHHRDNKTALPMHILSKVKVLVVYWDSKRGVGHEAEVEVLSPDYKEKRRPHTRCFIWLDPTLYSQYHLNNNSGWSHETRTTIKLVMDGIDDREKSIALYNIAVDLENEFEERWMANIPGRPGPLSKLVYEKKAVSRQTKQPVATTEPSERPTPMKSPVLHRQPTPLVKSEQEQTSIKTKPGMSLRERFHKDFLELFGLPEHYTYDNLTEQQQTLYPAQFAKWKSANS